MKRMNKEEIKNLREAKKFAENANKEYLKSTWYEPYVPPSRRLKVVPVVPVEIPVQIVEVPQEVAVEQKNEVIGESVAVEQKIEVTGEVTGEVAGQPTGEAAENNQQ